MTKDEMKYRAKQSALRVIELVESLPDSVVAKMPEGRLLRGGTSAGADYRAACRARSTADFLRKEEESVESVEWLELRTGSGIFQLVRLRDLMDEGNQTVAITVSSIKTVNARRQQHSSPKG